MLIDKGLWKLLRVAETATIFAKTGPVTGKEVTTRSFWETSDTGLIKAGNINVLVSYTGLSEGLNVEGGTGELLESISYNHHLQKTEIVIM